MPSPQNSINTREGSTSKKNYTGNRFGNNHGSISFGHIHKDASVTSDILLQGSDGRHGITLDKDGERKGWTTITSPGNLSIKSGLDNVEEQDTIFINALNGNIDIIASNGKIRLQGTDIELIAVGEGGGKGNIRMKASENIEFDAKKVLINATAMYKLATAGTAQICANSAMTIYSSVIRGVTDAVANRDSKLTGAQAYQQSQVV